MQIEPYLMKIDGFDDCIAGVAMQFGTQKAIIYDRDLIIMKLMNDGMTREDAVEFFDYNIDGAYIGEYTPMILIKKGELDGYI